MRVEQRNPRIDPEVGDILRGKWSEKTITGLSGNVVYFRTRGLGRLRNHPFPEKSVLNLSNFRRWALNAEASKNVQDFPGSTSGIEGGQ